MNLISMKCEKGLYFADTVLGYSGRREIATSSYRFNGKEGNVTNTFHKSWYLLKGEDEIKKVEQKVAGKRVNFRWELKDPEDTSLGLPLSMDKVESCEYYDEDDYESYIGSGCKHYKFRSLYVRKWDMTDPTWEEIEFSVEDKGVISVTDVDNFQDMSLVVSTRRDSYTDYKNVDIMADLSSVANYADIERMLVPELAIHNRPCSISADATYNIIRAHIKNNIVGSCARVTSDYDFCITVKKVINIKEYVHKKEIKKANGKSYAKPKYNSKLVTSELVDAFEMCPSKPYEGYTPIKGFKGNNLQDLADNIKLYLDELMDYLNTPLDRCPHCEGTGVIATTFDINNRYFNRSK